MANRFYIVILINNAMHATSKPYISAFILNFTE